MQGRQLTDVQPEEGAAALGDRPGAEAAASPSPAIVPLASQPDYAAPQGFSPIWNCQIWLYVRLLRFWRNPR